MKAVQPTPGRFFIISFPEPVPSDRTLRCVLDNHFGGLILFADHCRDPRGLKSWLGDFSASMPYPLIVAVDQEGGRVCRFRDSFPPLESPRNYGTAGNLSRYQADLAPVCERLKDIGINLNLVPTVDLFDDDQGHVLDSRTFSSDPEIVARFARATIEEHHRFGLATCAKHFPGLGRSTGDPHQVLSVADLTDDDFRRIELVPFGDAIKAGVDAIMVTHLAIPNVDDAPAIVSAKVITGWLKEMLLFDGPVITDDLLMLGARQAVPPPMTAVRSFQAGADLLLFGRDLEGARRGFDAFASFWETGRLTPARITDAKSRVNRLLKTIMTGP
jgi:beta-N-acetylhexosaminidase